MKLAAYGYPHLAALLDMPEAVVRVEVRQGRLIFNKLSSIIAFVVSDKDRLARVLKMAASSQLPLVSDARKSTRRRNAPQESR
jgi:hypothetical protein